MYSVGKRSRPRQRKLTYPSSAYATIRLVTTNSQVSLPPVSNCFASNAERLETFNVGNGNFLQLVDTLHLIEKCTSICEMITPIPPLASSHDLQRIRNRIAAREDGSHPFLGAKCVGPSNGCQIRDLVSANSIVAEEPEGLGQ